MSTQNTPTGEHWNENGSFQILEFCRGFWEKPTLDSPTGIYCVLNSARERIVPPTVKCHIFDEKSLQCLTVLLKVTSDRWLLSRTAWSGVVHIQMELWVLMISLICGIQ